MGGVVVVVTFFKVVKVVESQRFIEHADEEKDKGAKSIGCAKKMARAKRHET